MTVRRSPIAWFGGKGRLAKHLVPLLPPHRHYVEPFGGGASVLIRKEPSGGVETYNDLDEGLTTMFRVIADPELFPHFRELVELLPNSRSFFNDYRHTWKEPKDPVERAARWFLVARQSFSANWGNSWGTSVGHATGGMASQSAKWINSIAGLPEIHARLRRVQVEQMDFRHVLRRYQGPGYLAYCDPPYVMSTRRGGRYACELTDQDHQELVDILLRYDGAVILSGYRSALYEPLAAAGWRRLDIEVTCSAVGRTRATGLLGLRAMRPEHRRTESIWCNPETIARHGGTLPALHLPKAHHYEED